MENAIKLIQEINKNVGQWDKSSSFKIGNIDNLSISDVRTAKLYAEIYVKSCGHFKGLVSPTGEVANVLHDYGLKIESASLV